MPSHWLINLESPNQDSASRDRIGSDIRSSSARRPMLSWLAIAMLVFIGGCVTPCFTGACNSKDSLYVSPMARFGAVEKRIPECGPTKSSKPFPYFTFGKYWPFLDEWKTTTTATKAARKVLWKQMWETKQWINAHYRAGFTQAYIDVANGGNGELPPVPPPRYWNAHFRSAKGQWRAERWFDGYRAGAAMALVEMQSLRRITASYDWSIQKPQEPFVSSPLGASNVCPPMGRPPVVPTGGFGMPGSQYQGQPIPSYGPPNQPMAPGYGTPPGQFGPQRYPPPGNNIQSPPPAYGGPGPAGAFPGGPGIGAPPQGFAPGTGPQPQRPLPNPSGIAIPAQPPAGQTIGPAANQPLTPGLSGAPAVTGNSESITPAPGGRPLQPKPKPLVPGFSSDANRPSGIPNDPPVWRTRPPQNPGQ